MLPRPVLLAQLGQNPEPHNTKNKPKNDDVLRDTAEDAPSRLFRSSYPGHIVMDYKVPSRIISENFHPRSEQPWGTARSNTLSTLSYEQSY